MSQAEKDSLFCQMAIVRVMRSALTAHQLKECADALFHTRLIWADVIEEERREQTHETQGKGGGNP